MPMLAPIAMIGSMATSLLGASAAANGAAAQGQSALALGQYQQQQYLQEGYNAVATSQRQAEEQQYKNKLVQSTLTARAAGGGTDPSIGSANVLSQQIAQRGMYSSLMDLSHGQDLQADYENQGAGALYSGELARAMVPVEQTGAYAGAAGSMFSTLGRFGSSSGLFGALPSPGGGFG